MTTMVMGMWVGRNGDAGFCWMRNEALICGMHVSRGYNDGKSMTITERAPQSGCLHIVGP